MSRGRRFTALDGIRALAVMLVFIHHVDQKLFPGGWLGVDLFFALSGYLITTLLLREVKTSGRIDFRAFYIRRALRLVPALAALVVVMVPALLIVGEGRPLVEGPAALLYLMDFYAPAAGNLGGAFGHTWSLAVEEQFYLLWPAVLLAGVHRRWRLSAVVVASMVVFTAGAALLAVTTSASAAYRSPLPHFPELAAGVLLAFAVARRAAWLRRLSNPVLPGVIVAALMAALFLLNERHAWLYFGGFALIGLVLTGLVGHIVTTPNGPAARAFSWRPAVWLGQRSYGLYLWHYPVLLSLAHFVHSTVARGVVGLVLSLIATQLSWLVVEQPFLRMKGRFERVPSAGEVVVAPAQPTAA